MRARLFITTVGLSIFAIPAAYAQSPVQVDVVTDDAADDFFTETPPAPAPETTRDRADRMFKDLEAEEAGQDTGLGGPRPAEATVTPGDAKQDVKATTKRRRRHRWWSRAGHQPGIGDVMLRMQGGAHAAGGFMGMGVEVMTGRRTGFRLTGMGTFFRSNDFRSEEDPSGNWNFFSGGDWAGLPTVSPRNTVEGSAYLVDLSMVRHIIRLWRFDIYGTIGVSNFGYDIELKNNARLRGGEGYARLGGGANFHFGRIFAGVDFGWHPLALWRYELGDETREGGLVDIPDRWESSRMVTSLHLGFRF